MKVGILTGGGDAPGLNAVVRAIVRKAIQEYGYETVGVIDGWRGLVAGEFVPLNLNSVSGILHKGGTILGTSRTNPFKSEDGANAILKNISEQGIDALIAIGGEDTLGVASKIHELGVPIVGVPKTIDNDLVGTDYSFGFQTAVTIACDALDKLHSTAEAHHRVIILEVMGRNTGWIALEAGVAGGADAILIPEYPFDIEEVYDSISRRQRSGKNFSLIVVAEGATPKGGAETLYSSKVDEFGHERLGGIGYHLEREIKRKFPKTDARVVILGHLQRGGSPTPFDRVLATKLGTRAAEMIENREFGFMVGVKGKSLVNVPLHAVAKGPRLVPLNDPLLESARAVGTCFGD